MTDQVYSAEQVLSVVGKISERDEWTGEERALLGTILASGAAQYRETLPADDQATFDTEVAELSARMSRLTTSRDSYFSAVVASANLVTKTVTSSTTTTPPSPLRPGIRRIGEIQNLFDSEPGCRFQ